MNLDRDLSILTTIKQFLNHGYHPQSYDEETETLIMINVRQQQVQIAEVPKRIAEFIQAI